MLKSKYSKIERERKFLIAPDFDLIKGLPLKTITDLYVDNTHLRLRKMSGPSGEIYKLTKKTALPTAGSFEITTIYLEQTEHELLSQSAGTTVEKTRYLKDLHPFTMGIDRYYRDGAETWLAEIEFETEEQMKMFALPMPYEVEITGNNEFSGFALAN